ncbi:Phosphotransferase [Pleurostoma richardsiae]|uniref:Phosphotransferase n=1 Tax=Pleurostoma richardsiae TaxID=41990 RepID=A0AA38RQM0_9PEZI|nr:Phosphotransferase [Pleurostoma richardsiae]
MDDRAPFDLVAWDRRDTASETWRRSFLRYSTLRKLEAFVTEKLGQPATWVSPVKLGGYNFLCRMRVQGSDQDVMVRLPQPGIVQFSDEKTLREAAVVQFLTQNTRVPVPPVLLYGLSSLAPEVGPFLIIRHVENRGSISHTLTKPRQEDPDEADVLNPCISGDVLEAFYNKIAVYLLQLFGSTFQRIGSLAQTGEHIFSVAGRPVTQNMDNMIGLANIPRTALPPEDTTYGTADEWYVAMAEMHMSQLIFQHNDLVATADDCRNKYVARQLFRRLAKQGRLSTFGFAEDDWSAQSRSQTSSVSAAPSGSGSFRLWCDDFRPSNMLLDGSDEIVAFVDWEFAYAAPTQFALDPPWWLLLYVPEMWHTGIEGWTRDYEPRLETWLRAMEKAEISTGMGGFGLSTYMRESWRNGRFWLNYAARKSWAFDAIFWKCLDERFFGKREEEVTEYDLWKTRIQLLSEEERRAMEPFVTRKVEETRERILVDWEDQEVKKRLAEVLF